MYKSGTVGTFMSRLHQLTTGRSELYGNSSFKDEGISYSIYPIGLQETWNREYKRKYQQITCIRSLSFPYEKTARNKR